MASPHDKLIAEMIAAETDSGRAPDAREVIREARMALQGALSHRPPSEYLPNTFGQGGQPVKLAKWREANGANIARRVSEARRILEMWEGR